MDPTTAQGAEQAGLMASVAALSAALIALVRRRGKAVAPEHKAPDDCAERRYNGREIQRRVVSLEAWRQQTSDALHTGLVESVKLQAETKATLDEIAAEQERARERGENMMNLLVRVADKVGIVVMG